MKISNLNTTPPPLAGKKIVLDPGHGGADPGALGRVLGVQEKDVNLDVSLKLRDLLVGMGADVRMTRDSDTSVAPPGSSKREELQARVDVANKWKADVYVSVHSNSFTRTDKNGTECYHARQASPHSRVLAALTHQQIVERLGLKDNGVLPADFYVIKNTTMPATLVETAYLSNPQDEAVLARPEARTEFAAALAEGLKGYFAVAQALDEHGIQHVPPPPGPADEFLLAG